MSVFTGLVQDHGSVAAIETTGDGDGGGSFLYLVMPIRLNV